MKSQNYDLILFDLDDTLLDFTKSEKLSFRKTLESHIENKNFQEIYNDYKNISQSLWGRLEKREITKDFLRVHRFELLFKKHNITLKAFDASEEYLSHLPRNVVLIDGAYDLCKTLSKKLEIGIITNGIEEVQKERLSRSGLTSFISFMVTSEASGFAKPDKRIFSTALQQANHTSCPLMVGDRIESDILGAQNAKIDSCWFNPSRKTNSSQVNPTHEIHNLSEFIDLVSINLC